MRRLLFLALILPFLATVDASAHSGGTDADGCHVDSSTGESHCHNDDTGMTEGENGDMSGDADDQ